MLTRVAEIITRYSMFRQGQRVGVAVSGGADSVCLLHVLVELAPRWNLQLRVLHLDHRLRGEESREDARFVEEKAAALGLPFQGTEEDVARLARERGGNLEEVAREVRYAFFGSLLETGAVDRVALGHTRSDQAETVLFRFLRGSGTAGLAGIRPVTPLGLVRPLLSVGRREVEAFLAERGIGWREDASNADPVFARNRIRHGLLPELTRDWNPALPETLARTAEWALDEEAYWEAELNRLAPRYLAGKPPAVLMRSGELLALPPAVARRLVRRAIELVKGDLRQLDFRHIQAILALAAGGEGHGRLQVPGVDVFRSFEWLRLAPPGRDTLDNRNYRFPVAAPQTVAIPGLDLRLSLEVGESRKKAQSYDSVYNTRVDELDRGQISGSLELRNWRPGDQYHPVGHTGVAKIKELFQLARIPIWERRHWPVLISGDTILWARRFGPAAAFAAGPESRSILSIRELCDVH